MRGLVWLALLAGGCNSLLGIDPPLEVRLVDGGVDLAWPAPDAADAPPAPAVDLAAPEDVAPADLASDSPPEVGTAGTLTRVSLSTDGTQANAYTSGVSVSGDGMRVAFSSPATNLVLRDFNDKSDIFVHERGSGTTTRVSLAADNSEPDGDCGDPVMTTDGRSVVFSSVARNLVPVAPMAGQLIFSKDLVDGFPVALRSRLADDYCWSPAASADASVVAFETQSGNIDGGDTNTLADVYAAWGGRGQISRISTGGDLANGASHTPSVSADGELVAFASDASNLVAGDSNGVPDIFVRGLRDPVVTRVNLSSTGEQANQRSDIVALSGDGRRVAFCSAATNLITGDTNRTTDVFVHDLFSHQTVRVSVSSTGAEGNGSSCSPSLNGDGRLVAFASRASNLVPGDVAFVGDTNYEDIFVHDLVTHQTVRVSVGPTGVGGRADSRAPHLSSNGRVVVFLSDAPNLVPGDSNGTTDAFAYQFTRAPWF